MYEGPTLIPWYFVGLLGLLFARPMPLMGKLMVMSLGPIGLLLGIADRLTAPATPLTPPDPVSNADETKE